MADLRQGAERFGNRRVPLFILCRQIVVNIVRIVVEVRVPAHRRAEVSFQRVIHRDIAKFREAHGEFAIQRSSFGLSRDLQQLFTNDGYNAPGRNEIEELIPKSFPFTVLNGAHVDQSSLVFLSRAILGKTRTERKKILLTFDPKKSASNLLPDARPRSGGGADRYAR